MAETLIAAARTGGRQAAAGTVHVAVLAGGYTNASILRVSGLRRSVAADASVSF